MPQKRSTYGDIVTTHTGTDAPEPRAATPADEQRNKRTKPHCRGNTTEGRQQILNKYTATYHTDPM